MKAKLVIFISGRGSNMQRIVEETQNGILKDVAEVILVFSNNPGAPGLKIARKAGIPTLSIPPEGKTRREYDLEIMQLLQQYDFDYIILAGYMRILSPEFVRNYPKKIINIHPADTRLHQGLEAYKWAFENKLRSTKITVHFVDEGVDTGEIIAQKEVNLSGVRSLKEVEKRGLATEHRFYPRILSELIKKNTKPLNNNFRAKPKEKNVNL